MFMGPTPKAKYCYPVRSGDWAENGGCLLSNWDATYFPGGVGCPGPNTSPYWMSDVEGEFPLNAVTPWLTGTAPTAPPGPQSGYWRMGPAARVKYTGPATMVWIEVFCTATGSWQPPSVGNLYAANAKGLPNTVGITTWDGTNWTSQFSAKCDNPGYNIVAVPLPLVSAKTVEIYQPYQQTNYNEYIGALPLGAYITRIWFNAPMFLVPQPAPGNHLICEVDAVGLGGDLACPSIMGVASLLKRGSAVQPVPAINVSAGSAYATAAIGGAAAYNSGTAYSPGSANQYANVGVWVWKCIAPCTGVAPSLANYTNWLLWGYNGRVTLIGYGGMVLYDNWGSTGSATAAATARAALAPTAMWVQCQLMDSLLFPAAQNGTLVSRLLSSMFAVAPTLPIFCQGSIQIGNPELVSAYSTATPAQVRAAMAASVAAFTNGGLNTYASGLAWVYISQYEMTFQSPYTGGIPLFPGTEAVQQSYLTQLQPNITT
jgi:hypothetical protein